MTEKIQRAQVHDDYIDLALGTIESKMNYRLEEKGRGGLVSTYEVMGLLLEEFREAAEACHVNAFGDFLEELVDVAVVVVFALASANAGCMDR